MYASTVFYTHVHSHHIKTLGLEKVAGGLPCSSLENEENKTRKALQNSLHLQAEAKNRKDGTLRRRKICEESVCSCSILSLLSSF